jgi:predicted lipoprotein with Yx(FWY)xxD motif
MHNSSRLLLLGMALLLSFLWGCATAPTVLLREKESAGKYLTDEKGMTLYYYKNDLDSQSTCIDNCIKRWPAFYRETVTVPDGLNANDFSTISHIEGSRQTAYKGRPLYYFYDDKQPGDMKGDGINNAWYVIYPDKFKP